MEEKYPDDEDFFTNKYILSLGEEGIASEKNIFKIIRKSIKKINRSNLSLADLGCGEGRMVFEFEDLFSQIYAIEKDNKRLFYFSHQMCKKLAKKVSLINLPIDQIIFKNKVDVIFLSHIIQHIRVSEVVKIIDMCYDALNPDGMLFIMTSYTRKPIDIYTKIVRTNDDSQSIEISRSEYENIVLENKTLPVHYFSFQNLINIVAQFHFRTMNLKKYHTNIDTYSLSTKGYINNENEDILISCKK